MTKEELKEFIKRLKQTHNTYNFLYYADVSYDTLKRINNDASVKLSTYNKVIKKAKSFQNKLNSECQLMTEKQ